KLLNYVPYSRNNKLLTIPFEDKQLLLSTEIGGTVQITSFINHTLQLLQSGKDSLQTSSQKQQWKSAVLMFNQLNIRNRTFDHAVPVVKCDKDASEVSRKIQEWKDVVLMFNESIIRTRTFDVAFEAITVGFVECLAFERSAIFSYSKIDELGIGLSAYHVDR